MSLPPWSSCSNLSAHKSCSKLLLKGRRRRPSPAHLHNHHHHCKQPTGHNPAEKSNFTKSRPDPELGCWPVRPWWTSCQPAGQVAGTLCSHSGAAALARWPVPSRLPPEPSHRESSHHCHHPPPSNIGHFLPLGHQVQKCLRSVGLLLYLHFLSLFACFACFCVFRFNVFFF